MSTVVQRTYRPQIAPAVAGMIADEVRASVDTRIVETSAGIGFGLAVGQGTKDDGCVLGGSNFVGITVRDVTLDRLPIDPLSIAVNPAPVDTYQQYQNAGVLSTGRIWVVPGANVTAGDGLFYSTTTGVLTNSASGTAASGYITFAGQPAAGQTITIGGGTSSVVTFVASGATGLQVNIGPTLGDTLTALATFLNGSADANIVLSKYAALPPSPGGAGQGSGANTLQISTKAVGVAGNAYTIATNVTGATVSGATQTGGSASATAVVGGYWASAGLGGTLAKVSLGIQR